MLFLSQSVRKHIFNNSSEIIICPLQEHLPRVSQRLERTFLLWEDNHTAPSHPGDTERGTRGSRKFKSNRFRRVPSMFYYQQFRKAVWINKAAVSLNYQYIKMYLRTTKDCLAELLFSALFQGENQGLVFLKAYSGNAV